MLERETREERMKSGERKNIPLKEGHEEGPMRLLAFSHEVDVENPHAYILFGGSAVRT
jgi:hypothetical protein